MAAPVVAAVTTTITNGPPWTGAKPSGTVENDLLIAHLVDDQADQTPLTSPAGWTLLHESVTPIGADVRVWIYTKLAGGSEPADYTWTFSDFGSEGALCIARITGVDITTQIDLSAESTEDGSTTTHDSATIETTVVDTLALFFCSADESSPKSRPYWQAIVGMTTEYDFEGDSTVYAGCYSEAIPTASSVQRTATTSDSDTSAMVIMAIRPGGAAPPSPSPPVGSLASTGVGR